MAICENCGHVNREPIHSYEPVILDSRDRIDRVLGGLFCACGKCSQCVWRQRQNAKLEEELMDMILRKVGL